MFVTGSYRRRFALILLLAAAVHAWAIGAHAVMGLAPGAASALGELCTAAGLVKAGEASGGDAGSVLLHASACPTCAVAALALPQSGISGSGLLLPGVAGAALPPHVRTVTLSPLDLFSAPRAPPSSRT